MQKNHVFKYYKRILALKLRENPIYRFWTLYVIVTCECLNPTVNGDTEICQILSWIFYLSLTPVFCIFFRFTQKIILNTNIRAVDEQKKIFKCDMFFFNKMCLYRNLMQIFKTFPCSVLKFLFNFPNYIAAKNIL